MNTRRLLLPVSLTSFLCGTAALSGCEDADAAARAEAHEAIIEASENYAEVVLANPDHVTANASEGTTAVLREVAQTSAAVNTDAPGQKAAAAILGSSAHVDLALQHLTSATRPLAEQRARREVVRRLAAEAQRLQQRAEAMTLFDPSQERPVLEEAAAEARRRQEELRGQLDELRGPTEQLRSQIEELQAKVRPLREQAQDRREAAFEAGDYAGYEDIVRAVELDRQADRLELQIAQREIALSELEAERAYLQQRLDQAGLSIERAQQAGQDIEELAASFAAEEEALRQEAGELERTVSSEVESIAGAAEADVLPTLDRAEQAAAQAVQAADAAARASRREAQNAARLMKVRALQVAGQVQDQRVRALADEVAMLSFLQQVGVGGDVAADLEAARTALEEANAKEREAYQEAIEAAGQVRGDLAAEAERLAAYLSAAMGEELVLPTGDDTASMGGGAAPTQGTGAASPEALLQQLRGLEQSRDLDGIVAIMHASGPEGQQAKAATAKLLGALDNLLAAMESQFPGSADQLASAGALGGVAGAFGSNLGSATVRTTGENSAVIVAPNPMGGPAQETPLIRTDVGWFIDLDAAASGQNAQSLTALVAMSDQMTSTINGLVQRIRGGEFDSLEEATQAMMQAFMGGMGGMGSGSGG